MISDQNDHLEPEYQLRLSKSAKTNSIFGIIIVNFVCMQNFIKIGKNKFSDHRDQNDQKINLSDFDEILHTN